MLRTVLILSLGLASLWLTGCGDEAAADEAAQAQGERAEDRANKARALWIASGAASKPDKMKLYEQIIGLYPETEYAEKAHFKMIGVLTQASIGRYDDALEEVRVFAERYPTSELVVEAWSWLANHWPGDDDPAVAFRTEWRGWLKKTRARDDLDPITKARLWLQSSYAAVAAGESDEGAALLAQALPWSIEDKRLELEIAFRGGSLQASLGNKEDAVAAFGKALALAKAGARGFSETVIQEALTALDRNP